MPSYHYLGNEDETIPEDVSELVIHPLVQRIPHAACEGYHRLISVNFNGSALQIIGRRAFCKCTALKEIEIPPSVTAIEEYAFSGCHSLTRVRFHEDGALTTIEMAAFIFCSSLTDISIPSSVNTIQDLAFGKCKCLARVSFQEGLKMIEGFGFGDCTKLEYVGIPGSLEVLGGTALCGCTSLREVNIEAGNLRVIRSQTFSELYNLQTINIPSTVERIEGRAFQSCRSLIVIKFQKGLRNIDDKAFYLCKNLQAVELPASIETIGDHAFGECPKLVSVGWEDHHSTVTIHKDALAQCKSLVNISLPSQCRIPHCFPRTRNDKIFQGCEALEKQYGSMMTKHNLMHRFENLPIHKKCYQASSVTTADELAREIESSKQMFQENTNDLLVDPFDMTPFHVLLSAASCRIDLLQVLLDSYPPAALGWKDVNGKRAFEYLTQRKFLTEDSRHMLRMALVGWLVDSISSWKGLDVWKSDMARRVDAIVAEDEMEQRESLLEDALVVLSRYERITATTLLELSLWKMELKSVNASADDGTRIIVEKYDREAFRIRSGASVVIPNVIALLGP
ncbi:MAG: hypothetical protein SGBAC_011415 [Bacillariaceae sp.]